MNTESSDVGVGHELTVIPFAEIGMIDGVHASHIRDKFAYRLVSVQTERYFVPVTG